MKILFAATEAYPFIRTGGLGDVIGALSKELSKDKENDVRVIIPKYKTIKEELRKEIKHVKHIFVDVGWRHQYCGIEMLEKDNIKFYFIDNEDYFGRDKLYGEYDDGERFAFFSRAVLEVLQSIDWYPNILHCNDWQTGMIPALYKLEYRFKKGYEKIKTVYSIHNLLFQGNFRKEVLEDLFGYNLEPFNNGSLEFYGGISYMKGGISYSDKVITVSNTYAEEIKTSEYGERMEGLLSAKGENLIGILNGIDYEEYNPETDKYIYEKYNSQTIEKKWVNKESFQKDLCLKVDKNIPIIALVSRLAWQKGVDLIKDIIENVLQENVQVIILGNGDLEYENYFKNLEWRYKEKVRSLIMFDTEMAQKVYASADIFLMPSKFEPCGLGQLIALRYGTIPVVRETGGLSDTIDAYNKYTKEGNGFSFENYSSLELKNCIFEALEIYKEKEDWNKLIEKAMVEDNSWINSAAKYKNVYKELILK